MRNRKRHRRERPVLTPYLKQEREMIISQDDFETRVAFLEEGRLAEYYFERQAEASIVGNIYKGRVNAVLPGLQAAFVDIGLEKAGFLHARDVVTDSFTIEDYMDAKQARKQEDALGDEEPERNEGGRGGRRPIQELLTKGQEILVQVEKESISTKGPRLTAQLSMPSRMLVLIPGAQHSGVSHRLTQEATRSRLKKILDRITPKGFGVIARTSAENATEKELAAEVQFLLKLWKQIKTQEKRVTAPAALHSEQGLLHRVIRDLLTDEDKKIVIDSLRHGKDVKKWLGSFLTSLKPKVDLYRGKLPLFEALNLDAEVEKALRPKVWLKCGGYLVIEETEALVVVDVNTGRNVGRQRQDETILRTNLEAAQEIGRQLRLRDLGGIIVLDFIDMRLPEHKERVYQELLKAVRRDRAKTSVRKLTDLGLIEMTRKRVRGSLLRSMGSPCPHCQGLGWVSSPDSIRIRVLRLLERAERLTGEKSFKLEVPAQWQGQAQAADLVDRAQQAKRQLVIAVNPGLRSDALKVVSTATNVVVIGEE
ncbi:MAG: Rne/Rng family ribonuclease [candidate division FCPU426 bacterium]